MSQKMGRPKSDNPKDIRFSIRLDAELKRKLDQYCKSKNISTAEAIRRGINLLLKE